jgi:HEAT repeat protein
MNEVASLWPLLQHPDPKERVRAARALEKLALPGRTPDPPVLEALKQGIPVFLAALKDSERLVRLCSVRILGELGPFEGAAVAAVAELLLRPDEDSVMRDAAMDTLGMMGPGALPSLWQLWKTKGKGKGWRVRVLTSARYAGPAALPLILAGFKRKNPDYWVYVEESIGLLEEQFHCDVAPALIEALGSPKPLLCVNAGGLLLARRPELRRHVVGRLRPFLRHPKPAVRLATVWALQKTDDGMEDALPELLALLPPAKGEAPGLRAGVLEVLCRLGPKAAGAVPVLADIVRHDPGGHGGCPFSKLAAEALGEIGPQAAAAVPALTAMLKDDRPTMPTGIPNSIFAAIALGAIGPAARPAVPALKALLRRTIPELRHNVAGALEHIRGPEARESWWKRLFRRGGDGRPDNN